MFGDISFGESKLNRYSEYIKSDSYLKHCSFGIVFNRYFYFSFLKGISARLSLIIPFNQNFKGQSDTGDIIMGPGGTVIVVDNRNLPFEHKPSLELTCGILIF